MGDGAEEPPFSPQARIGEVESRRHPVRLVAGMEVHGDEVAARSAAYIFGENTAGGNWRIGFLMPARYSGAWLPVTRS